jgi:hypothetical protein
MASKQDYRRAQVEAISVQSNAKVSTQQVLSLEKQAMWNALAEVVKANPEAASNVAIVAAVAAARDGEGSQTESSGMALIKTERDVTALDWAKVLVPASVNGLTNVGIAAISNRTSRAAIRANAAVNLAEIEQQGRVYDVLGDAVSGESAVYNVSDGATFVGGDSSISTNTTNTTSTTNTTTTTTTTDDDIYVIGTTAGEADNAVDDAVIETSSFGLPDDEYTDTAGVGDDDSDGGDDDSDGGDDDTDDGGTDDGTDPVNCNEPQFSPAPPECSQE